MNDVTSSAALAEKYDAVAYGAQANPFSHPSHLAGLIRLFGLQPPPVATCRVLELGCSDGSNLLPMASMLPSAQFMGCDLSSRAITAAQASAAELGVTNVQFLQCDFAHLAEDLAPFDYIIAHGIYSWVPEAARDALFSVASRHLSQDGAMFVSYNVYPGCHIRKAAWEALHYHVDGIGDLRERLDAARNIAALLAEPGLTHEKSDVLFRDEFKRVSQQSDSALFHDDLGQPNDPVYFHEFAAHAARHGLGFVAEAKLLMMSSAGLSPHVQQFLAGKDRLAREQYLDFVRMRRFRQSVLCRTPVAARAQLIPAHVAGMHAAASTTLMRAAAEGKAFAAEPPASTQPALTESVILRGLLHALLECAPASMSDTAIRAWVDALRAGRPLPERFSVESMLLDACVIGTVDLSVDPATAVREPGDRPRAVLSARWQARRRVGVTNLRHETLTLQDEVALALLELLDGTRTRAHLAAALAPALGDTSTSNAEARVDEYLSGFARHALLLA